MGELASKYTDQERERGMVATALCSGNTRRASKELAEQGLRIPRRTLRSWQGSSGYEQVLKHVMPRIKAEAEEMHRDLARRAVATGRKLLARLDREHVDLPLDKLGTDLRNVATVAGIHSDKAKDLRDEPDVVVEHRRSPDETLRKLEAMGIVVLEGEGQEVEDEAPQLPPAA